MGTLYLVATPIGNLEDISARALRVLKEVRLIAAEDTRHTRKLLSHFDIHTPMTSYFEHNKYVKLDSILMTLEQGDVALVSDAGMPAINDPGIELVRSAVKMGYNVSPIPGANASISALAVSGLPTDTFIYLGYLPRKSIQRKKILEDVSAYPHTIIFLETPHRLVQALEDVLAVLGDRQMAVARELTKMHEEIYRSSVNEALHHYEHQPPLGEITMIIDGAKPGFKPKWSEDKLLAAIMHLLDEGVSTASTSSQLATESGWTKKEIYKLIIKARK